jgi:serine/threonine protein kinase
MYAAPGLLRSGSYHTQKADIWSVGILLYTMATGKFPFDGNNDHEIVHQIHRGKVKFPRSIDRDIEPMIRRFTTLNANERPTIPAIVEDHFFDEIRFSKQAKQTVLSTKKQIMRWSFPSGQC